MTAFPRFAVRTALTRCLLPSFALFAASAFASPSAAATLITDPFPLTQQTLRGATGVIVNGKSYDVSFVDGTCAQVFVGCNTSSDLNFQTSADAAAAAQALLDQVFVDSTVNIFQLYDSRPGLTAGCTLAYFCSAFIPFDVGPSLFSYALATNESSESGDMVSGISYLPQRTADLSSQPSGVYARFSLTQSAVPEPATWALMLLGFGGIGLAMRRKPRALLATA